MREHIIKTAADLFARNGYDATGVQELGEALGMGRGALYHHIESKENLLYEISIRHVVDMVEYSEEIVAADLPADEKFRAVSRRLMRMIAENLPEVTVFFHEYRSLAPEHRAEMEQIRDTFESAWARILQDGVDAGLFRAFHPVIIKGILGLYNYSYLWLEPDGSVRPEEIADMFSDMALRGLRVESR